MDNNNVSPEQNPGGQPQPEGQAPQTGVVYGQQVSPQVQSAGQDGILKNKKLLIVAGFGVGVVLLLLIIVLVAGGSDKPAAPQEASNQTSQNGLLDSARALDIEQINNSISQDISSMNDDSQLPATRLDDKTLGL